MPLSDDYIKFIRLAHHCLEQSHIGILGFITNSAYLSGLIHRGMRSELLGCFCQLYFTDLRGSALFSADSGSSIRDENVFDIRQGVAIGVFVKDYTDKSTTVLYRGDICGTRQQKYQSLMSARIDGRKFTVLEPQPPSFYLVPRNLTGDSEYEEYMVLNDVFPVNSLGIEFGSKEAFLHDSRNALIQLMRDVILNPMVTDQELASIYGLQTTSGWRFSDLRRKECVQKLQDRNLRECLASPFDAKYTYHSSILRRPQLDVLKNMHKKNLMMLSIRQSRAAEAGLFFVTRLIFSKDVISIKDRVSGFPLLIYNPDDSDEGLLRDPKVHPNFSVPFLTRLCKSLDLPHIPPYGLPQGLTSEDIFQYAYAVFYSLGYRTRYAEFLKIDFPRLPLTSSLDLFRGLSRLGGELVALHLVEAPVQTGISIRHDETGEWTYAYTTPSPVRVAFNGPAEPVVEKVGWSDDSVWIDAVKPKKGAADADLTGMVGFRGVPEEVWDFHIGGYQVCQKWLKDRKGRTLGVDDLVHYHRIVVALHETIRLMAEIDRVIAAHGGWPGAFVGEK